MAAGSGIAGAGSSGLVSAPFSASVLGAVAAPGAGRGVGTAAGAGGVARRRLLVLSAAAAGADASTLTTAGSGLGARAFSDWDFFPEMINGWPIGGAG